MLRSRARRCSMRLPRRNISPVSGVSKPAISRSVVLLPLPEGPSRTRLSPSPMEKLTSSRTCSEPNHLLKPRTITDCRALCLGAAQARVAWKEATISPAILYLAFDCGLRRSATEPQRHREGERKERRDCRNRPSLFLSFPPSLFLFVSVALCLCG